MKKLLNSKPFRWTLVLLCMLFIFSMSHLDATMSWLLTGRAIETVSSSITGEDETEGMTVNEELSNYSQHELRMLIVRKMAHVFEFMMLTIFLLNALVLSYDVKKSAKISMVVGILYAAFDEGHQLFVAGRTANIVDVGIDSMGVLLGLAFFILGYARLHQRKLKEVFNE